MGLSATTIASKLALNKVGLTLSSDDLAQALYEALGSLRGPLMKLPQLLATIPDFLPPAYQEKFMHLQANVPSMGNLFVKRRLKAELGPLWQQNFSSFDLKASFAASLGQVHKATLQDGTVVACKLQYPDMPSTVEADLTQLRMIVSLYHATHGAIQADEALKEIVEHITSELNYQHEASNMKIFHKIFKDDTTIHVPIPHLRLTTERLLTMTWMDGRPIIDFQTSNQETRNVLAKNLFRAWYKPLYHFGVLHGDPHMGNYTVRQDGSINLLDFGCVRFFSKQILKGIVELYYALKNNDNDRAYNAYELWGFKNLPKQLLPTLNLWAKFLYGPVLVDRPVNLQQEFPSRKGQEVASQVMMELKKLGGIKPPRSFVFMDRSAVGMGSVFLRLGAEINWHTLYEELLEDINPEHFSIPEKDS